ncbi:hypothetical protein IWX90DRAFT_192310 [Phyllosticta citrichinensis]|uniref:tryptophan--tRNA ligase n=1 Tax=Phyllosticta citrichinensis TaxID=1130410 RepID=A0ABR1XWU0_9PEZI
MLPSLPARRSLLRFAQCAHRVQARRQSTAAQPKVVFSGIQPTGIPHLGNYLGALQQWVKLQDSLGPDDTVIYSIVDLHALTMPKDAAQLRQWRTQMLASLLAVGLDPAKSTIFYQSDVPAHSELMWLLSCHASVGYLSRMTQWKSKMDVSNDSSVDSTAVRKRLKLGLFSYPVLQAADILVHRATHVPVGDDQRQHLEFARELAVGFNANVLRAPVLVKPETLFSPARRVMSLEDPAKKMSKSQGSDLSRIYITDSEEEIRHKIVKARTDSVPGVSHDTEARPAVSNLVEIMWHLGGAASVDDVVLQCRDLDMKAFKSKVADTVVEHLAPIRSRHLGYMDRPDHLREIAEHGADKARKRAGETMREIKDAIGL